MKYVKFTYVDAKTNIPVSEMPAKHGPKIPDKIYFLFALESEYPTDVPTFYGNTANATVLPDFIEEVTEDEFNAAKLQEFKTRLSTLKERKLNELKDNFIEYGIKPRIDTGLGFAVDGGYFNLIDFQSGVELEFYTVRDADNILHTLTREEMLTIVSAIQQNGLNSYNKKWTLEDTIKNIEIETADEYDEKVAELRNIDISFE